MKVLDNGLLKSVATLLQTKRCDHMRGVLSHIRLQKSGWEASFNFRQFVRNPAKCSDFRSDLAHLFFKYVTQNLEEANDDLTTWLLKFGRLILG